MNNKSFIVTKLIVFFLLTSCKTYKPIVNQSLTGSATEYINTFKKVAVAEMKRTGVPASITLAQGMIESNYGKSTLSREANNHFGIKCHNGWTGPTVHHDDDRRNECFRKYKNATESFEDHSDFLKNGSRYAFLFDLSPYDYKEWAKGLKKAGYATNPDYANMLIRKIEELNLMIYDKEIVAGRNSEQTEKQQTVVPDPKDNGDNITASLSSNAVQARVSRIMEKNRIQYIIAKDGETREDIEEQFNLLSWELARYNELGDDFELRNGQILYLQPKRDKAEPGQNTHTVENGDTMYSISQKYGIKLRSLYELNRMEPGTQPVPGAKIWLRTTKPVE
ncbi:MAG TPA: glucosaminidase domain-containing protein [Bacteroidales bacterium]|nr:glucosaminidase domain-containing protein [Bacteroidales bacterium]